MPGSPVLHYLLEFAQTHSIESVMPSSHLILLLLSPRAFSLAASGSFLMSQFFASDGQSIGVSASVSVLPMKIQS